MTIDVLSQVDLCFVVDTTGSMGSFIAAAKAQLLNAIGLLSAQNEMDVQVGLVEYRDHPPQERSFITRVYPLTARIEQMQKQIDRLGASGGGDGAEAVYQGIFDACEQMQWRKHSCHFILLVGDAPPHGFAAWRQAIAAENWRYGSDSWAGGCPSGLQVESVTAAAEVQRVTIYALCMGSDRVTQEAFRAISAFTGGNCQSASNGSQVVEQMLAVLTQEFRNVEFDRQVLEQLQQTATADPSAIALALDCSAWTVAASIARLGKRGLIAV